MFCLHAAELSIRFLLRKISRVSSPWGTWLRTRYWGIEREERKNPCTRQESNPQPQEFCSAGVCSTPVLQPLPFVPYHLMHNIVRTINFCPDSLKVTWKQTTTLEGSERFLGFDCRPLFQQHFLFSQIATLKILNWYSNLVQLREKRMCLCALLAS